jgi:hypothetical protein
MVCISHLSQFRYDITSFYFKRAFNDRVTQQCVRYLGDTKRLGTQSRSFNFIGYTEIQIKLRQSNTKARNLLALQSLLQTKTQNCYHDLSTAQVS